MMCSCEKKEFSALRNFLFLATAHHLRVKQKLKDLLNRSLKNAHFSITCKLWTTLQDASTSYDLFCNFPYCLPDIAHNFSLENLVLNQMIIY